MKSSWSTLIYNYSGSKTYDIENITSGKNPALILKNFYDTKSCELACSKIKTHSIHNHDEGVIKKIGVFLSAYLQRPDDYFNSIKQAQKKVDRIFFNLENPFEKIKSLLSNSIQKEVFVAKENGSEYSKGVVRIHDPGDFAPIHRDSAKFEAKGFAVSKYDSQISCVLHLKSPQKGGELKIYKQFWKKQDEKFRNPGFGYSKKVIDATESTIIKPEEGDLVIINPLLYHEILPIKDSKRISLGMFFGFSKNLNKAVLWA